MAAAAGASDEFSDEFKDISQEQGSGLVGEGRKFESRDKEYHHPDLYKYQSGRPYDIPNLCAPWDGKQVWAIVERDPEDPDKAIWRQGTVLASCPPNPKEPNYKKEAWSFIVDTKHDSWRALMKQKPTDETFLSFENLQVTEYVLLPGKDDPHHEYQAPTYFDILPADSPMLDVAKGATPVHPWVADELRALKKLIEELKRDNAALTAENRAKTAEIEARRLNEEQLAKALQKEKDERKISEDKLNRQLAELRESERALLAKVSSLKDLINELQGEVNALSTKNEILAKENELQIATIAELKTDNDDLSTLVTGVQAALSESNLSRANLEEENRILRDRIQALDEALQKTIDSSNQSAHDAALKYAVEKAGMQAEIDRLRELLARGVGAAPAVSTTTTNITNVTLSEDDLELRRRTAMITEELKDKSELLAQSFEEIKRLKELVDACSGIDWKKIYEDIKKLGERCGVLESARGWKQGIVGSVALDEEDELAKYKIYDGDEERAQKRKERADRKKARALIRLSAALVGEVNLVDARIVELEKRVEALPRAPPAANVVPSPATYGAGNDRFIKVNKSDWLSQQMQLQFLAGEKENTNKLSTAGDIEVMQAQVAYLVQRNQDLMDLVSGFPDGKPKYTPTYARVLKGIFGGSQYDGNFPWLLTRQRDRLEQENADLVKKMDLAAGKHLQQAELAETLMQPIATENAALREKLQLYRAKLEELEKALEAAREEAKAAHPAAAASGFLEILGAGVAGAAESVNSSFQEAAKTVGAV